MHDTSVQSENRLKRRLSALLRRQRRPHRSASTKRPKYGNDPDRSSHCEDIVIPNYAKKLSRSVQMVQAPSIKVGFHVDRCYSCYRGKSGSVAFNLSIIFPRPALCYVLTSVYSAQRSFIVERTIVYEDVSRWSRAGMLIRVSRVRGRSRQMEVKVWGGR